MTKVTCAEDCGNSPRILLLKKVLTAFAKGDSAFILKQMAEDVAWLRPGAASLQGKAAVAQVLAAMQREPVAELVIDNILTHGPAGAANGVMRLANGGSYSFSHVYRFKSAGNPLIKEITVYLIKT
jgi:hypothetical protein